MNKHKNLIAAVVTAVALMGCLFQKKTTVSETDMINQGFQKAMVISYEIDGCKYMLELEENKKRLEPDGLQPEFEKDSLKVWIKYKHADRMSVCMAGETIDLVEIRKR